MSVFTFCGSPNFWRVYIPGLCAAAVVAPRTTATSWSVAAVIVCLAGTNAVERRLLSAVPPAERLKALGRDR